MLFPPYSVRRLEGGEQLVAREWHLCHPHTDRVVDRVDDRRRRRTHGRLAQSVATERAVRLWLLDDDDLGGRRVLDRKRTVVGQLRVARQPGGLHEWWLVARA